VGHAETKGLRYQVARETSNRAPVRRPAARARAASPPESGASPRHDGSVRRSLRE